MECPRCGHMPTSSRATRCTCACHEPIWKTPNTVVIQQEQPADTWNPLYSTYEPAS